MPGDAEAVRKALQAELRSPDWAASLDAVYAEKGELTVLYPREIYEEKQFQPQVFPCAEIDLSRTTRQNPDEFTLDQVHEIDLYWHNNGADAARIRAELERYVRSVEDYFLLRPHIFSIAGSVRTGDVDWSPLMRFTETGPFFKSAVQQVFIRVQR
jgi:hypothetical protein